ncbi:MAG: DUF4328 domain-containing protein [Actinobacteria bacterium]|nr:DUF4328 domain-containing protein [Actinomycetota bacterium]
MSDFSMPMPPPPSPITTPTFTPTGGLSKLNSAIWVLLLVSAVAGLGETLFAFLRSLVAFSLIEDFSYDTADSAIILDDISSVFTGINFLIAIPVFVLLVIYSHQFSQKVIASGHKMTLPLGMSIGSWFIPLANAVLCFIIFFDFVKLSMATKKKNFLLLNLWWWMWIAGVHLSLAFNSAFGETETWDGVTAGLSVLNGLSSLVATAAMVCGALFFRELRQVEMNLQPAVTP